MIFHRRAHQVLYPALVIAVLTLVAAPAYAVQPIRAVHGPAEPSISTAGFGCAFDVLWEPSADARSMTFEFGDGRWVRIANGNPVLTNLSNGETFQHAARYHGTERYDAVTNEITWTVNGSIVSEFWPGDVGPNGVVSEPGLLLRVTGMSTITMDAETFAFTAYSFAGTITDVCAELAG